MSDAIPLEDRFAGCLLGLAVGDALGARFEGQSPEWVAQRYRDPQALLDNPPGDVLSYTDDTQMAVAVAETLAEHGEIDEPALCQAFVANYVPSRGYSFGTRRVIEAMEEGGDYRQVAASYYPGGSLGNGAAMRVAPVGVYFHDDLGRAWEQAGQSALPTHRHPLGVEGGQLLAVAAALCARGNRDRAALFGELASRCQSAEFREKLKRAARLEAPQGLKELGNGIRAPDSVVTAVACFALSPDDYATAVGRAVLLGGDTDTIAAMTGALAGTYLGAAAIPAGWLGRLEDEGKGRTYLRSLAGRLWQSYVARWGAS